MTSRQLLQAVARATGDDLATIRQMGFQPLRRTPFERDPEGYSVDWDELDQSRNVPVCPPRVSSYAAA